MHARTTYSSHYDLAQLPWFEVRDGRLVADPDIAPAADVHTHLALGFLRPIQVDLRREHPETRHYLALERPLDLEVYINKNFTPGDLRALKRDLTWDSWTARGMRETHTAANLIREMGELGIVRSCLLPIDFPALSWNAEAYLEIADEYDELVSFGSVHPHARNPGDKLQWQKDRGALAIKVHPAVQMVAPDHPRAMRLYRLCADLDLPILWHCGPVGIEPRLGRYLSQLKHYWRAVAENPDTVFVLGHSGALQMGMGLELAQRYPNVWLESSSQSLTNIRRILAEGPQDRIMHGSDWPFYHQAPSLAKLLIATEGQPELRRRVLWDNAAKLFGFPAVA